MITSVVAQRFSSAAASALCAATRQRSCAHASGSPATNSAVRSCTAICAHLRSLTWAVPSARNISRATQLRTSGPSASSGGRVGSGGAPHERVHARALRLYVAGHRAQRVQRHGAQLAAAVRVHALVAQQQHAQQTRDALGGRNLRANACDGDGGRWTRCSAPAGA